MNPHDATLGTPPEPPTIVLDTNVVLDWLVFDDPLTRSFAHGIESARLRWLVTAEMRDELAHVLTRGLKSVPVLDSLSVWRHWDGLSVLMPLPAARKSISSVHRCADPDDQKFIDLAISSGARWLLSRDKAVLRLARQVKPIGLDIATPKQWAARPPETHPSSI